MAKVLYIEASPRKKRSASIAVANTFLDEYRRSHPQDEIITIDLWKKELPRFAEDTIDAKYAIMHNQKHTPEQAKAWKNVENVIAEFVNADKYIISTPMWNFSIPYKLKHYIDVLVQPTYTFEITKSGGYNGLVVGKKMLIIYASGGAYSAGSGAEQLDFQRKYMNTIMGFIGFKDIGSIIVEPTLGSQEQKTAALTAAHAAAKQIAPTF